MMDKFPLQYLEPGRECERRGTKMGRKMNKAALSAVVRRGVQRRARWTQGVGQELKRESTGLSGTQLRIWMNGPSEVRAGAREHVGANR